MIKEKKLYDQFGDHVAMSVNLNDVHAFIQHNWPQLRTTIHFNNYDEYGVEHYILINGACADIKLEKNYGGMFIGQDYIECHIIIHDEYNFTGKAPASKAIGEQYTRQITEFINAHLHYLHKNGLFTKNKKQDDLLTQRRKQSRYIVQTQYGTVMIESPCDLDPDNDFYDEPQWTSTLIVNSDYAPTAKGSSREQSLKNLINELEKWGIS